MSVLDEDGENSQMPGPDDPLAGGAGSTQYIGNVPHARRPAPIKAPFGGSIPGNRLGSTTVKGYKKGDQVALLPSNGQKLASLQQGLYQAGYITDAQAAQMVPGSPDDITTAAFAKLLATANMSGTDWNTALSQRLAAKGAQAPEETETPPLTVELTDPEAIKQTLDMTSRKLLGGYMTPEQKDAFVAQFQASQTAAQTAQYYQQYEPGVGYGPGGTTVTPDMEAQAKVYAKTTDPNQYKATQFGSQVHQQLESLRSTGYLSNQENNL